jgi:hypothetical protein
VAKAEKKQPVDRSSFQKVVEHIDGLSDQQFRQSLIDAGILDAEGQLTRKYTDKKKKPGKASS